MSLERKLLTALDTPEKIEQVYEMGLRAEVFEEAFTDHLYRWVIDYWNKSARTAAPTQAMLIAERPAYHPYVEVEEQHWWLAEELMKRAVTNDVQKMVIEATQTAAIEGKPVEALSKLMESAYQAAEKTVPRHSRSDMTDYESRRRRHQAREEGKEAGVSFGLPGLDRHTGGLWPGELCVVGAYSGVGKTFFLTRAAVHARSIGLHPIIFSLEMSVEEVEDIIDAMVSDVSYDRHSKDELYPQEKWWLHACQEHATHNMNKILVEQPPRGERTVAHLTARARQAGADVLIIDQLSHLESSRQLPTQKMKFADILENLSVDIKKPQAKLPCVLAAQFNRESLDHTEPRLTDFADADECARFAHFAFGICRRREDQINRMARFDVMKGRRGGEAAWTLNWDLVNRTHISEWERVDR